MTRLRQVGAVAAVALLGGCAGYNLQLGTGSDARSSGGFYEVYEKPATSVETPTERSTSQTNTPAPPGAETGSTTSATDRKDSKPPAAGTQ